MLLFIIGVIVGFGLGWLLGKNHSSATSPLNRRRQDGANQNLSQINQKRIQKKEQAKAKLLNYMDTEEQITNKDVQKLLGVSGRSATRYLQELQDSGKVKQHNEKGRNVYYTLVK